MTDHHSKAYQVLSTYGKRASSGNIGPFDWVVLFPLFAVVATQLEISDDPGSGGVAFFIRAVAALAFLCGMAMRFGMSTIHRNIVIISIFFLYFFIINVGHFSYFLVMSFVFMTWGLSFSIVNQIAWRERLGFLLHAYLIFNVFGLVLAFVIFFLSGKIVDLHGLVFPFSASRAGVMMNQVRLSGFQIEPGNYSNIVYVIVLIRCLLRGRITNSLDIIAMLSTILTLAAWAVVGAAVYFVCLTIEFSIFNPRIPKLLRIAIFLFSLSILAISLPIIAPHIFGSEYAQYFGDRFSVDEGKGSGYYKEQAFGAWSEYFGPEMFFGSPMTETFCDYCLSIQDIGLVFNILFYLGIIPSSILLLFCLMNLLRRFGINFVVLFAPFLVTKFFFYDPMVWLVLGVVIFEGRRRRSFERVG